MYSMCTNRAAVRGKECGNRVLVTHGSGWETLYCHMRGVSIVVKAGQKIRRGQRLGRVGLSGSTEFPHGHFSVLKNRKFLDPATGQPLGAGCDASGTSLWRAPGRLAYQPMALYAVGFSARAIKGTTVKWDASSL